MKLPFDLNLKLVFRLLFPGFILATGFYPILGTVLEKLDLTEQIKTAYIVSALVFGWLIMIGDMHIYMLYEGRRYWPKFLWDWLLNREESRRQSAWIKATEGATTRIREEASVDLRGFPIDEETGNFVAKFPTRLGNLLNSFEGYSNLIYGMDSVFYWPRLWLVLAKDLRDDIDSLQAMADSTTYASFCLFISGFLSLGYTVLKFLNITVIEFLPTLGLLIGLTVAALLLGYLTYRVSLPLHAQFGDIFRSVFDVYRDKVLFPDVLAEVGRLTVNKDIDKLPKKLQYRKVWRYLHNYRVKFSEEGKAYTPNEVMKVLSDPSTLVELPEGTGMGTRLARLLFQIAKWLSSKSVSSM